MKLLHIFWSRELSDDEVVNQVRKQLNRNRYIRWLWLVISLVWFGLAVWLITAAFSWVEFLTKGSGVKWESFLLGVSTGLSFGTFFILLAGQALLWFWFFLEPLLWNRKDRLLLQYYDQVHEKH